MATSTVPELPDGLVERLCAGSSVRPARVAEVARRLAAEFRPDADELAAAVVAEGRAGRPDAT